MKYERVEAINWDNEFPKVPQCVHSAIDNAGKEILTKRSKKIKHFPKRRMLLLVAVITLLSGMTVFASANLWQQRMMEMNQEEIESYFLSIVSSRAPSFRYSRVLTEDEKSLWEEMKYMYQNQGMFPKGSLTMLKSADEYNGKIIGYDKESGTFFLPEKKLNEEQILQIIDFQHKEEYAVSNINELKEEQEIKEISVGADKEEKEKMSINDNISGYQFPLEAEELLISLTAGKEYLYLGFQTEIKRMAIGSETVESFYKLQENETVFALGSDQQDSVYLSLREYDKEKNTYRNRLVKIDSEGKVLAEFDLESAVYQPGETVENMLAYKMLTDEKGNLYVKCRNCPETAIFMFDSDGNYLDKIVIGQYKSHEVNGMSFGEDGFLYVLAAEQIVKVDINTKEVAASYPFWGDEMSAMADAVYPVDEKKFYILSYDGLFKYSVEEDSIQKVLSPFETDVFSEGWRYVPVTKEKWVFINMTDSRNLKYKITYLLFDS